MSDREFIIDTNKRLVCDICGKTATRHVIHVGSKKNVCFLCIKAMKDAMRYAFINGRL